MLQRSMAYMQQAQDAQALPICCVILQTNRGTRIWSDRALTDAETWTPTGGAYADGEVSAGGETMAGGQIVPILERATRLLDAGAPDESDIQADTLNTVLTSLSGRQVADISIAISNADLGPSKTLAMESWISGKLFLSFGFRGLSQQDWLQRFAGVVQRITLTKERVTLTAQAN